MPIGEGHVDYPTILRNLRDNRCDVCPVDRHPLPAGKRLAARSHADELRQHPQADWRGVVACIAFRIGVETPYIKQPSTQGKS